MTLSPAGALLVRLRGYRLPAVGLFIALTLLVSAERRLSEVYHNLRTAAGPGLENENSLDGDEIRVRLIAFNDDRPPTLLVATGGIVFLARFHPSERPLCEPIAWPEPRAPPSHLPSAA